MTEQIILSLYLTRKHIQGRQPPPSSHTLEEGPQWDIKIPELEKIFILDEH